jgi:sugar phosphate isomerase/epimerase
MNNIMSRRQLVKTAGVAAAASIIPQSISSAPKNNEKANFRFSINTSTISGQKPGILKYTDLAAKAGYDGIELWVRDVVEYMNQGNSITSLKKHIADNRLTVENAIGFATWLVDDDVQRKAAFVQMKDEMELMAQLGCKRIAACAKGLMPGDSFDLFKAGERYKQMIELGRQTGVMPQLEFWGHSPALFHLGQAIMIAAIANDPEVHILADVYHMFRGGSGFDTLKMLRGDVIEIFHMNDYVASIPREQQADKDRVYPGDGSAPMQQILGDLSAMGGTKVLSIELFNPDYWKQDPYLVAKTGLDKMKALVKAID